MRGSLSSCTFVCRTYNSGWWRQGAEKCELPSSNQSYISTWTKQKISCHSETWTNLTKKITDSLQACVRSGTVHPGNLATNESLKWKPEAMSQRENQTGGNEGELVTCWGMPETSFGALSIFIALSSLTCPVICWTTFWYPILFYWYVLILFRLFYIADIQKEVFGVLNLILSWPTFMLGSEYREKRAMFHCVQNEIHTQHSWWYVLEAYKLHLQTESLVLYRHWIMNLFFPKIDIIYIHHLMWKQQQWKADILISWCFEHCLAISYKG